MLALTFLIATQAFPAQGPIPSRYTCDGKNISPAIHWSEVPSNTKSMALIVDDPDAEPDIEGSKKQGFTHWVVYNIPPKATGIQENVKQDSLPKGTLEGKNDFGKTGYGGPCPPKGTHRYFFRLYALDTVLPNLNNPNREQLEKSMKGHIIGTSEVMGTYERGKKEQ